MARVTVEDCVEKVEDRFELVALAAQRAKNIAAGAPLTMERKGEKDTVIALREIADDNVLPEDLREDLVKSHQKIHEMDETTEHEPLESKPAIEKLVAEETEQAEVIAEEITEKQAVEEAKEEIKSADDASADLMFAEDNMDVDD